jgi:hypothetical protein
VVRWLVTGGPVAPKGQTLAKASYAPR